MTRYSWERLHVLYAGLPPDMTLLDEDASPLPHPGPDGCLLFNARDYGADPTGQVGSSAAIQAAIDAAARWPDDL